jgi:hypothetical protein
MYFVKVEGGHNLAANVHPFVLLGTSSIHRPRRRQSNAITKDKILFFQPPMLWRVFKDLVIRSKGGRPFFLSNDLACFIFFPVLEILYQEKKSPGH